MSSNISFNVAFDIFGIVSLILMLISYAMDKYDNEKKSKLFAMMLVIAVFQLLFDMVTQLIRGRVLISWVVSFFNNALFVLGYLMTLVFVRYLMELIDIGERKRTAFIHIASIGGAIFILLSLSNPITHIFFSVVDGLYKRSTTFLISQSYHVVIFVVCAIVILKSCIPFRQKLALLLYCVLPFFGVVLQSIFYGTNFSYVVIPISLQIVFINVHAQRGKLLAERENELTQARVAIMLSQIQPHFLYNSLTAIMDMCGPDSQEAREAISDFSDYLRANLDSLKNNRPIKFEKELKHLETYLRFEKKRFGDRLNVVYDIKTKDFTLPALTVQPLVENAVKHGICKKSGGGTVKISTEEFDESYYISVTDNGVGFDVNEKKHDGKTHIGIENIRSRLKAMSGGTLEIVSREGAGTTAIIKLPKKPNG